VSNKVPLAIAGLSTFFILIAVGVLSVFGQMAVLNGAKDSQAFNAMAASVICQSVYLLIAVVLARWLANLLITKFNWNKILAILVAIIVPTGLGAVIAFLAVIVTIPLLIKH
jgi:hypothetical protein